MPISLKTGRALATAAALLLLAACGSTPTGAENLPIYPTVQSGQALLPDWEHIPQNEVLPEENEEQIGAFLQNETAIKVGVLSSLILPSEALWKRAAYEMTSPLVQMLGVSPFSSPSVPSPLMVAYACGYLVLALVVAVRWFGGRDL